MPRGGGFVRCRNRHLGGHRGRGRLFDTLRDIADTGVPQVLIDGMGNVWGWYVLEKLTEKRTYMLDDGTPLEIDFSLTLKRVDDQP